MGNLVEIGYEVERNKPKPSKNHSVIQLNLGGELHSKYKQKYRFMSEIALGLESWDSVPNLAIFPKMDIDFLHDEIKITETPLGVIEILSPSQAIQDLNNKAENYFHQGVKSVWIVIPSLRAIAIFDSPYEYQMFTKGIATDSVLTIEVDLSEVFS